MTGLPCLILEKVVNASSFVSLIQYLQLQESKVSETPKISNVLCFTCEFKNLVYLVLSTALGDLIQNKPYQGKTSCKYVNINMLL